MPNSNVFSLAEPAIIRSKSTMASDIIENVAIDHHHRQTNQTSLNVILINIFVVRSSFSQSTWFQLNIDKMSEAAQKAVMVVLNEAITGMVKIVRDEERETNENKMQKLRMKLEKAETRIIALEKEVDGLRAQRACNKRALEMISKDMSHDLSPNSVRMKKERNAEAEGNVDSSQN